MSYGQEVVHRRCSLHPIRSEEKLWPHGRQLDLRAKKQVVRKMVGEALLGVGVGLGEGTRLIGKLLERPHGALVLSRHFEARCLLGVGGKELAAFSRGRAQPRRPPRACRQRRRATRGHRR